jgi:hypothetical protein
MEMINMKFYWLTQANIKSPMSFSTSARLEDDVVTELARGERQDWPDFYHKDGKNEVDLYRTNVFGLSVVSKGFVDAMMGADLEGFLFTSLRVLTSDRSTPLSGPLFGLSILGRSGPIRDELSQIGKRRNRHDVEYSVRIGRNFDEHTWDGSDLFFPEDTMMPVLSERAFDALEKLRSLNLIDIASLETVIA